MQRIHFTQSAGMAIITGALLVASPAYADETAEAARPADSGSSDAEEIIVTAQKRSEPLQKVPVSVAVVSGDMLQNRGIASLVDATQHVPAVFVSNSGPANLLFIRGIGSGDNNPLFEQSVATFVDGIYRGRSRSTQSSFLDLDRVEVLKGPQSVYFGNNAIAGAFNIATKNPGDRWEGFARGLYNFNFNNATVEGAVGGPITDRLGIRIAGLAQRGDGWVLDNSDGIRIPRVRNYAGRVTLKWEPTDNLTINVKAHAERNRQKGGLAIEYLYCPPTALFPKPSVGCAANLAAGEDGVINHKRNMDPAQRIDFDAQSVVSTINYDAGMFSLTSVTGYYHHRYDLALDVDGAAPRLINFSVPEKFSQFSQEFRIATDTGGAFDFFAGVYYEHDDVNGGIYANYPIFTPALTDLAPVLAPHLPFGQADEFRQKTDVFGVFASMTYRPTAQLDITVAGRQSWVDKDFTLDQFFGAAEDPFGRVARLPVGLQPLGAALGSSLRLGVTGIRAAHRSDQHFSPSVTIGYDFTPTVRGYVKYVNGFKAGGYNALEHTGLPNTLAFGPEYVDSYEIGLKSQFLNRRLTLNIAAFRSDFEGLQQSAIQTNGVTGGVFPVVTNAKGARSQGIEADIKWQVTSNLDANLSLTYLDSKFTDFTNAGGSSTDVAQGHPIVDLSGKRARFAPELSGVFSVTYTAALGSGLELKIQPDIFFTTRYNISSNNDPLLWQDGFAKLGATITLAQPSRGWELSVIGKNLTDRKVLNFATDNGGSYLASAEEPWSVSAQLRYNF